MASLTHNFATLDTLRPFRLQLEQETGGQIVHDSLHRRRGWTQSYLLALDRAPVGYGSIALAGPWQDKPTIFEFHVASEHRSHVFALFEYFLSVSGAHSFEVQSNHILLTTLLHTYAHNIVSEKIVFADHLPTNLPSQGATLRRITPEADLHRFIADRQGCADWALDLAGTTVATGGLCFHYNTPYCDLFYEVIASHLQRGLGAYLIQELKRAAYALGAIPAARCALHNVASRRALAKAGLVPRGHILLGTLPPTPPA